MNLLGLNPQVAAWFETKEVAEALRWLRVLEDPQLEAVEAGLVRPAEPPGFAPAAVAARMEAQMQRTFQQIQGQVPDGKAAYEQYPLGSDRILYSVAEAEAELARWRSEVEAASSPAAVARATGALITALGQRQAELAGRRYWINKTPELPRFGGELRRCLGECRMILMIRDGWEVAQSANALGWASVPELAAWWRGLIEESRAAGEPGAYLEIRYEDLIAAPAETLDRVLGFLGLHGSGEALCRVYHLLGGEFERRPPWQDGADGDRAAFDAIAGDLMQELGY
ncbi:hypothetical protein TVNIR_1931 [Thioalkalivibrio nitratireducens DSM 14787]|uniref:Sulfotransferase n=1 Tax=Thioalkalivibrio nitratireducens (strain DSM 14787 / UNIQEM 213 / ALEN2) TaxID=1255043 RepID=L0DX60_THIND|nr:hypothetical protein TVNIR_1931 [Thioalkalivibrio nitratireducens DSM 14787]